MYCQHMDVKNRKKVVEIILSSALYFSVADFILSSGLYYRCTVVCRDNKDLNQTIYVDTCQEAEHLVLSQTCQE